MPKLAKMEDTEPFSIEFGTVKYYSNPTYKGLWIGQQVVLQFGEYGYQCSIINDGYGGQEGLFEIGMFVYDEESAKFDMAPLPGVTHEDDSVRGYLQEEEMISLLKKVFILSGETPIQIN